MFMGDLNLEEYMTIDVMWEKYLGESELTNLPKYDKPVNIKCFKYGKSLYTREDLESGKINAQTYLVVEPVAARDKLDGQVIKDRSEFPVDFDTTRMLYECYTW